LEDQRNAQTFDGGAAGVICPLPTAAYESALPEGTLSEYIFLPLISFASGFASLYIDPKTDKARAWIVISVLFASALATGIYGYFDGKSHESEITAAQQQSAKQLDVAQKALDVEKTGQDKIDQLSKSVDALRSLLPQTEGDKASSPVAAAAQAAPAESAPPIVEYFAKGVDGDAIAKATKAAGLAVVVMPGQRPGSTNSMWVGNSVSISDTRSLALALIRQGVGLRAIRRFRDGSGAKARLIEIGRDEALTSVPVITAEQIQSLQELASR
jgi:hypothetical protein